LKRVKCARCGQVCKIGTIDIGELKGLRNYTCPECGTLYFYDRDSLIIDTVMDEAGKGNREGGIEYD